MMKLGDLEDIFSLHPKKYYYFTPYFDFRLLA